MSQFQNQNPYGQNQQGQFGDGQFGQGQFGDGQFAGAMALPISEVAPDTRVDFMRKTYAHLFGAVLAFIGIEFVIFSLFDVQAIFHTMFGSGLGWLVVLGAFMIVSWVAHSWASSQTSIGLQYAGLGLYVLVEAIIFVPILYVASMVGGAYVITTAAVTTLVMFGAMTVAVISSRKDFSFLGPILAVASIGALGFIVAAMFFNLDLGMLFTLAMVVLACGFILYDTSNVLHHYVPGQHVAASLALFSSLALLFWYILRLAIILNQE